LARSHSRKREILGEQDKKPPTRVRKGEPTYKPPKNLPSQKGQSKKRFAQAKKRTPTAVWERDNVGGMKERKHAAGVVESFSNSWLNPGENGGRRRMKKGGLYVGHARRGRTRCAGKGPYFVLRQGGAGQV